MSMPEPAVTPDDDAEDHNRRIRRIMKERQDELDARKVREKALAAAAQAVAGCDTQYHADRGSYTIAIAKQFERYIRGES